MPDAKKKGKAKKKPPAYVTTPEALEPFGYKVGEPMQTPLGLKATVLGFKPADGHVWVHYASGLDAPLEPTAQDGPLPALGYEKASPMELVLRDVAALQQEVTKWHEKQAADKLKALEKGKGGKGKPAAVGKKKK